MKLKTPVITMTAEATTIRWNLIGSPDSGSHGTRIPSAGLSAVMRKDFHLPVPGRRVSTTEASQAVPLLPRHPDDSAGQCWEQEETSLKLTSMNRARNGGKRTPNVRAMEMGVGPAAFFLQTLRAAGQD